MGEAAHEDAIDRVRYDVSFDLIIGCTIKIDTCDIRWYTIFGDIIAIRIINGDGLIAEGSFIVGNDINNSWNAIYLSKSNNNNVNYNNILNSGFNGIYLLYSKDNIIKDNEMVNCGLLVYGISLSEYIHDIDTSNKVNGKILYYYINENGITVPNDAGEVILVNCEYCNITDLDLSDGTIGIELAYSNYNTISKNTLKNSSGNCWIL